MPFVILALSAKKRLATAKAKAGTTSSETAPKIPKVALEQTSANPPVAAGLPNAALAQAPNISTQQETNLRPDSPPRDAGGDIVFDFAEYNNPDIRVVAAKQAVSNGTKKKPKLSDEQYEDIKEQISKMEKNMTRRIDRLQGTVAFTAKCIEDFNDNFSAIMEVVKEQRVRGVSANILHEVTFPFQSTVDVAAYIDQDPHMVKLIDRYVCTRT